MGPSSNLGDDGFYDARFGKPGSLRSLSLCYLKRICIDVVLLSSFISL